MTRTATPTDECRDWLDADRALHRFLGREDGPFCWLEQQSEEVQEHYHRLRRCHSIMESLRLTASHHHGPPVSGT